ncbi:MAG TPA: hypothetical protein PK323_06010 [Bacteroidia bacterium]|nr:hypothetical protein [Bacteroidia bacterium]
MKKPIKINTDRDPISSDEIKEHQNFKHTWQKQYLKPKPFYRKPKFFGAVILLLCMVVVLIIDYNENKESELNIKKVGPQKKALEQPLDKGDSANIIFDSTQILNIKEGEVK